MLAVCEDVLLEYLNEDNDIQMWSDMHFNEAVDTLFGYDGVNVDSFAVDEGLLFPQPLKVYRTKEDYRND